MAGGLKRAMLASLLRNRRRMASQAPTDDPYAAPRAALVAASTRPGAPLDALLLGFLVAFVGASVGSSLLHLATLLAPVQARFDHLQLAVATRLAIQLVSVASAFAGGYCCARAARQRELALGAVLGAITLVVGALSDAGNDGALRNIVFTAAVFATTLLGALLGRRQNGHAVGAT